MSNSIAPGSSADVNVRVTALTTNPNVSVQYKTVILKKNIVNGVNTLTQAMMSDENTKYVIKYDYVLSSDITVPVNCVLEFDGGSLNSNDYIVNANNCEVLGRKNEMNDCIYNSKDDKRNINALFVYQFNFNYLNMSDPTYINFMLSEMRKASKYGYDGVIVPIHLHYNTDHLEVYENIQMLKETINYALNIGLTFKGIKIHYTDPTSVATTSFANLYSSIVLSIANEFLQYNPEYCTILNECSDYSMGGDDEIVQIYNNLASSLKNIGYSYVGTTPAFPEKEQIYPNFNVFCTNYYPQCGYNKKAISPNDIKERIDGGIFDAINYAINNFDKVIISETGVKNNWNALAVPSNWSSVYDPTDDSPEPVVRYLTAVFESDIANVVNEIWDWWNLYWNDNSIGKVIRHYTGKR